MDNIANKTDSSAELQDASTSHRPTKILSVIVPVFNEKYFIKQVIQRISEAPLPTGVSREIIVVDDGSTDGSDKLLADMSKELPTELKVYTHDQNRGKGAAIRTAIQKAKGDVTVIQDADLEYHPNEYAKLMTPILAGEADVVYGSRFAAGEYRRILLFWHTVGNRFITALSNITTNLNLTDIMTCHKMARTSILKSIPIRCDRFGIEAELTAKFAKRGCRIFETPISYRGRTFHEGKKTSWFDGIKAIWVILTFWLVDDIYEEHYGHDILHSLSQTHRFNRWMADVIRPYTGDRILEIGSGIGNLTNQLLPREYYMASDIDPLHLEFLHNMFLDNDSIQVGTVNLEQATDFDELEGTFNTVVCLNVLEHVPDDIQGLDNIWRALKPGGRAIILVPRGKWLFGSLDVVLEHARRYSPDELCTKMENAGFQIESRVPFNRVGVLGWIWNAKLLKCTKFGKIQLKIYDSFVWLWRIADRFLPWPSLSIIAIGVKRDR